MGKMKSNLAHARLMCVGLVMVLAIALGQMPRTSFDVQLATPPPLQQNQFQLQAQVSTLMSAGNVYYDADLDSVPLQAYEITDVDGNPLGPYLMTNDKFEEYVLDFTPITNGGVGLHPYFRGVELVNASQRAWRLDWYKDGTGGAPYTTVMSGAMLDQGNGVYTLSVDLGLRWSEEGDNLNRLNQGRFSHIALAIGDFRSFTLAIDQGNPGAAQLSADVFSVSPTESPTALPTISTASPVAAPNESPTASPLDSSESASPVTAPTLSPFSARVGVTASPTDSGQNRGESGTGGTGGAGGNGGGEYGSSKGSKGSKGGSHDDDCGHDKGKKGKGKGCKGKKHKGKLSFEDLHMDDTQGGLMVGATAGVFLIAGWALVAYRQRQASQDGYESVEVDAEPPVPTIPTAFAAFGTFSAEEIKRQAKLMRVPPVHATVHTTDTMSAGRIN
eukprot:m.93149 g.93149  ORF g.93149 m.93149 type:complete len:445 (-) comp26609_c2_seq1:183-1517(-)